MKNKKIVLIETGKRSDGFNENLRKELEALDCDVAVCDANDTNQLLGLISENRLPVTLK